jgi:hypothetical protein
MSDQFKMFSVVWTMGIEAPSAEEAVLHAHALRHDVATVYHVRKDVDNNTLVDDELTLDRGYTSIDVEEITPIAEFISQDVALNIQALLCASWSQPEDDYIIPTFLLKHKPVTYATLVIVDPEGIAIVTQVEV